MSYLALARKWRPGSFADVIGQEHVVSALSNALNNQRVHHAFLFTGTRGVGKTTLARIFAKALNCESGVSATPCGECSACASIEHGNFVDLIEVDAASRTKIDDTRELLDNVQYTPTQGRYKIYLIDEVHMLSTHSFNALLKTLEEPPEHVKFLLATTDPQKLPTTILSRCIQFNLKSVELDQLQAQLTKILDSESINYELSAIGVIARSANGSVRDALSLLDQAIAYSNSNISTEHVRNMLGMIDDQLIFQLFNQICRREGVNCLETIRQMAEKSADYFSALDDLLTLIHNIALYQVDPGSLKWKGLEPENFDLISKETDQENLQLLYQIALMGKKDIDYAPDPKSGFEMIVIRMISFLPDDGSNTKIRRSAPHSETNSVNPETESAPGFVGEKSSTEIPAVESKPPEMLRNTGNFTVAELATEAGWINFAESSKLNGLVKQLLMNMVPRSHVNNEISVSLAESSRHLYNNQRKQKIEQYCQSILGLDIKLSVEVVDFETSDTLAETPHQKQARQQAQQTAQAEHTFSQDPNVQQLIDAFDAEIVTESIRTVSPVSQT